MFKRIPRELWIGLAATLFFIPFLGNVHLFDWDEINFAECAREMLVTGDFGRVYINFQPFWEKPPFFFWLQALSMHVLGVSDFAARLPNAICGILTLIIIFRIGKKLYNETFGFFWVMVFGGSILPHLYFRSGIIDPWFNLFIFLALYFYILYYWKKDLIQHLAFTRPAWFYIFFSGIFLGLALITKGPVALLILGLTIFARWALLKFRLYFSVFEMLIFTFSTAMVSLVWYGYEFFKNGSWFITRFIKYNFTLFSTEDSGHGGFFGYHFLVLLLGCFPGSLFFILGHYRNKETTKSLVDFRLHLMILFWVVLILFSVVQSKIVHYSSLCYFPITYVGALALFKLYNEELKMPVWIKWSIFSTCLLIGSACIALPYLAQHLGLLKTVLSKDPVAVANLDTKVYWSGREWTVGLFVFAVAASSILLFNQKKMALGFTTLFGGSALMLTFILWAFIGKVEAITQGTAITFFESLAERDCNILPYEYKTFAPYFYGRLQKADKPRYYYPNELWRGRIESRDSLLLGKNKKDVYLITKINKKAGLEKYTALKLVFEKNGWSVWKKDKM